MTPDAPCDDEPREAYPGIADLRDPARRLVLRAGIWIVPAVLGTFAVGRGAEAHTTGKPKHCLPCTPHGGPGCSPPCGP